MVKVTRRKKNDSLDNLSWLQDMQKRVSDLASEDATLEGLVRALEQVDLPKEGHNVRVTAYAMLLGRQMCLSEDDLQMLRQGALLHDVGKMAIPETILLKPGALTETEWQFMKRHTELGYELLAPIQQLKPILSAVRSHHENWDGTGYPDGLKGEEIHPLARILAVVEVWDSLIVEAPFRHAWPIGLAVDYIRENSGTKFDPAVVDAFLKIMSPGG